MKRVFKILPFLLLTFTFSFAQENPGARQVALSHADVAFPADPFSLFNNPAGSAEINSNTIGIYYSPSPFGLKELSNGFGTISHPALFGTISGGFMIYGFELYKETKLTLGFGKKFTNNFLAGISIAYKNISIKNYGAKGFIILNAGGIAELSKKINIGFVFENFTRTTINNEENQIPVVFRTGISYKVIDELQLFTAIKNEIGYNVSFRFGAEYFLLDLFQLRFGTANEPNIYSGGIGINYKMFQVDYAVSSHHLLGLTHQFGLIISF